MVNHSPYNNIEDESELIDVFQILARIADEKDSLALVKLLNKLGSYYYFEKQYTDALYYYQQSLTIAQAIPDRHLEALTLLNLGWIYARLASQDGQYKQMLESHHQCLEIAQSINDRWLIASSSISLGQTYLELKQYNQAIDYTQPSLVIAQEIHDLSLELQALSILRQSYIALGEEIPQRLTSVIPSGESVLKELKINSADLKVDRGKPHRVQYRAVINWLTKDYPKNGIQNLEQVKGYLQSFDHLCSASDWQAATALISIRLNTPTSEALHNQLHTWGYYIEQRKLYQQLLNKIDLAWDVVCLNGLAIVHTACGEYAEAIALQERHAKTAAAIQDRQSEGYAIGNTGLNYYYLGQYTSAIEYLQASLNIMRQMQDYRAEQMFLGNLGLAYYGLGNYQQAVTCHQQALELAQTHRYRRGVGEASCNLGNAYAGMGDFVKAVEYHQQHLAIAREGTRSPSRK